MSFHHCEGLERLVSLPTIIDWGLARTTEAYCGETPNHQSWGSTLGILEQIRQGGGAEECGGLVYNNREPPYGGGHKVCNLAPPQGAQKGRGRGEWATELVTHLRCSIYI